ncbi:MAG: divalent-cation tolerance protein CutA [Syntrophales bacterium]|nr:divalent-cation tolerance protein CutA [Syntrophales bacterium]
MNGKYLQIITTIAQRETADIIARALVEKKLAACVQILGPMTSIYRWQGAVEEAEEWQLVIKSRADCYNDVEALIRVLHPYEIPEILALPIQTGLADYLHWLDDNIEPGPK